MEKKDLLKKLESTLAKIEEALESKVKTEATDTATKVELAYISKDPINGFHDIVFIINGKRQLFTGTTATAEKARRLGRDNAFKALEYVKDMALQLPDSMQKSVALEAEAPVLQYIKGAKEKYKDNAPIVDLLSNIENMVNAIASTVKTEGEDNDIEPCSNDTLSLVGAEIEDNSDLDFDTATIWDCKEYFAKEMGQPGFDRDFFCIKTESGMDDIKDQFLDTRLKYAVVALDGAKEVIDNYNNAHPELKDKVNTDLANLVKAQPEAQQKVMIGILTGDPMSVEEIKELPNVDGSIKALNTILKYINSNLA